MEEIHITMSQKTGAKLLLDAIKNSNVEYIKNLVNIGMDINFKNSCGQTLLHLAIGYQNLQIVNFLLSSVASENIDFQAQDKIGDTALDYAIHGNNLKLVEILLEAQTTANSADENSITNARKKALFFAIKKNHVKFFESLLALQYNLINSSDSEGLTPLHLAIGYESSEIVNFLLSSVLNNKTALNYATCNNNVELFKILLNADKNSTTTNAREKALFLAIKKNNILFFESLLAQQVNLINSRSSRGWTPLHVAASFNRGESHLKIVETLLKLGADVNAQNEDGQSPLHYMSGEADEKALKLFLSYKPDVNIKDKYGDISLYTAVFERNYIIVKLLVDSGADVNSVNNDDITIWHVACKNYHEKIIKILVKKGAYLEAPDSDGWTPPARIVDYFFWPRGFERPRGIMTFLFKYADANSAIEYLKSDNPHEDIWKVTLEHVAKVQALDLPVPPSIFKIISESTEFNDYFKKCTEELKVAKETKFQNCWITYFNLLVDGQRNLKNYAGNQDLVENFNVKNCMKKFPIYGNTMCRKVTKGIKRRKMYDKCTVNLSNCLPILNQTHLILRNVLDCMLNIKDLSKLC